MCLQNPPKVLKDNLHNTRRTHIKDTSSNMPSSGSSSHDEDDLADHLAAIGPDAKSAELPGRVAQWYYKHGLFLSSYPTCATSIAIVVILLSW